MTTNLNVFLKKNVHERAQRSGPAASHRKLSATSVLLEAIRVNLEVNVTKFVYPLMLQIFIRNTCVCL